MSDYTPTTHLVQSAYAAVHMVRGDSAAEFDRWLANHDEEIRKAEQQRIVEEVENLNDWEPPIEIVFEIVKGEK